MDWMQLYFKLKIIVPVTIWAIVLGIWLVYIGIDKWDDLTHWWKKKRKKC